jgi:hypothetical protein
MAFTTQYPTHLSADATHIIYDTMPDVFIFNLFACESSFLDRSVVLTLSFEQNMSK